METKIIASINLAFFKKLKLNRSETLSLTIRKGVLLVLYCSIITNTNAQKTWDSIYPNNPTNIIAQTLDNKFIVAGSVRIGMINVWSIMHLNSFGKIVHDTILSTAEGQFYNITATSDSGYLIVGYIKVEGLYDSYFLKFNKNNKLQWDKKYPLDVAPTGYNFIETKSGYTILGSVPATNYPYNNNLVLLKLNTNGDSTWSNKYNNIIVNNIQLIKAIDSGYYFLGVKDSLGCLFELNASGDSVRTIATSNAFYGTSLVKTSDSSLVIGGGGFTKVDLKGNIIWTKQYPLSCYKIIPAFDGGYITINQLQSQNTPNANILKLDNKGDSVWSLTHNYYSVTDIIQTSDSMFVVTGLDYHYGWVAKFDSLGKGLITSMPIMLINNAAISNYPNPFSASTIIKWDIPEGNTGSVTVRIKNLAGQLFYEKTIIGQNSMIYTPDNNINSLLIVELQTRNNLYTKKILRIKN